MYLYIIHLKIRVVLRKRWILSNLKEIFVKKSLGVLKEKIFYVIHDSNYVELRTKDLKLNKDN